MGVLADKDYEKIIDTLAPYAGEFVCVTPDSERALPAQDLAAFLQEKGLTATACDSVKEGIRLSLKKASVSSLPFGDGFFDTVYSVESYFFWPDLPNDMREICRVLKSGGTFAIIVEMVAGDMSDRFEKITEHLHMNVLAPEQLAEVYRQAGFTDMTYDWDKEKGWLVMQGRKA